MNKNRGFIICLLLIILLIVNFTIASAVDTSGLEEGVENVKDKAENIKEFTEEDKWEYLSEQWRGILLKSKVISGIDNFMKKVDSFYVFVFLFNERYSLSITFFFILIYWIFFFFFFNNIFKSTLPFEKGVCSLIALASAVIIGHLGLYSWLSLITFKIIFYKEGIWGWAFIILFFILYFVFLIYIKTFVNKIVITFRNIKNKKRQKELEFKVKKSEKFIEEERKGL